MNRPSHNRATTASLAIIASAVHLGSGITGYTEPARLNIIDAFDYRDTAAVQAAWRSTSTGETSVEVEVSAGKTLTRMSAPFASHPDLPRASIDRDVALNLAAASSFSLDIRESGSPPTKGVRVSLYFRSGKGWFSGGSTVAGAGWRTLVFSKDKFTIEGTPAGWQQIDGIRISIWRPSGGEVRDMAFHIRRLEAQANHTAILLPGRENPERKTSESAGERIAHMLRETGIGTDLIETASLAHGALGSRPLAILPHNPKLDPQAIAALIDYVEKGGKLMVCYSLPTRLAETLGFGRGQYFAQKNAGDFASILFTDKDIPGLPVRVDQASWNITTATAVAHNARAIGHWLDRDGEPTGHPAMLISDRGAFFSHVVLGDDPMGKREMLSAIVGKLAPALWAEAAQSSLRKAPRIGHLSTLKELKTLVGSGPGADDLTRGEKGFSLAIARLADAGAFAAYNEAQAARKSLVRAYSKAQPSPPVEARAFWNHSGTGAYPGDWDRTAREMAAGGLNIILPNMLWGGQAHYPSDLLPRSKTFADHGDQIAQCVSAAHKHGIEVHVWKVNFNLGYGVPEEYVQRLRDAGRLQMSVDGEPGDWLNPAHPENFKLELESILEVVRKYDIDGFHFDYIRYPNSKNDFSDFSRRQFERDTGKQVENWPGDCYDGPLREAYTDWRCSQITRLVKTVSERAREIRPGIKISAAVFSSYPSCRESVAQDWPLWAREGYVDFLCPMDYTADDEKYASLITAQKALVPEGFLLYPGIGVSLRGRTQSADRVLGQIHLNRKVGTDGFTIFNLNEFTLRDIAAAMSLGAGETKAVPPHQRTK